MPTINHAITNRMRQTPGRRALVRETELLPRQVIAPVFVTDVASMAGPIGSMPGVERHTVSSVIEFAGRLIESGVRAVLLFGVTNAGDGVGRPACDPRGIVPSAVRELRRAYPDLVIMTDVCLCGYTTHGHCGVLTNGSPAIDRQSTNEALAEMSLVHADAGVDVVAPSAMIDGMVGSIRHALDAGGFDQTAIMSYAVKYASAFYGPFRDAAASAPSFGDRRSHQMDPANAREAVTEAETDLAEGADLLMVKPGGPNLDVVSLVRDRLPQTTLAAYQVSGEYAAIVAAAQRGWLDERAAALESLVALRRAGADLVISYWADRIGSWLGEEAER